MEKLKPLSLLKNPNEAQSMLNKIKDLDWVFSTPLEKIIVLGSVIYTLWSIIKMVWLLF